MTIRNLFPTPFYEGAIDPALLEDLEHSCRSLARDDRAGRAWSKEHGYAGYTSYASLTDLPQRDPAFDDLRRDLDRHVKAFAAAAHLDIAKRLKLDSLWVNVLKGGGHSGHIHPHSIVSGTVYVSVPPGAGALKLEDPRLPLMMASPSRLLDAPEETRNFVYAVPQPGTVFLWESWLRHEVPSGSAKTERISISFNYS
ncbi:2OG-Fe(II) oxygenase-related protein [Polymorphobacter glacialis]|uniref:2OG-Fe(II) oxygenase-related protein n=1 Tax=Sandarakinorhabdus glacialis TaxID=1614636 RepID=A0A916ZVR1_9SPHN|nr:TIGR02466 family protein [Polymorphobacter glacialis]GGE16038.1 2OG-Fe(II) oxygenase-related protein [Polymorphobacter glacialis]